MGLRNLHSPFSLEQPTRLGLVYYKLASASGPMFFAIGGCIAT